MADWIGVAMAQRTCVLDGCVLPHYGRGMCRPHYRADYRRRTGRNRQAEYFERECIVCTTAFRSARQGGKFCSDACKGDHYRTTAFCKLPRAHPVMVAIRAQRPAPKVRQVPTPRQGECEWCGTEFTTTKSTQRMCSSDCKVKAKRNRRRGRRYGSTSHYTWTEVMHVFLAFGKCCAYCEQPVDGQPDPDHVVPLSKGGSNSITNILPSCRLCNGDKRDLLLEEWAADRKRRGLAPRVTSWALDDPRTRHLTSLHAVA